MGFILKSIEKGYTPGEDIALALDCAATEYFKNGKYELVGEGKSPSPQANAEYFWPIRQPLSDRLDRRRHVGR
ncbi:MAG: hypothetical protein R3C27_16335 [Hyphomonadaceae bacterium]